MDIELPTIRQSDYEALLCQRNDLHAELAALLTRHNALVIEHAALLINNTALVEAVRPVVANWNGWKQWLKDSDEEIEDYTEKISFCGVPKIAAGVMVEQLNTLAALVGEA
jgi:hypothetical protein